MNRQKLKCQPVLMNNSFTPETRRGVLLIIVLLILTLFMLLGTTYVIVATRAKKTAESFSESSLDGSPTLKAARSVIYFSSHALLRGGDESGLPPPVQTFLKSSLLADKYGDAETKNYSLLSADNINGGTKPFFELTLNSNSLPTPIIPGDYTGRIATIEDSKEAGKCFRIVWVYSNAGKQKMIVVQANPSATFTPSTVKSGWNLVINGREFAGEDGSPNESYDAPDEQNLAMAWLQPEALAGPNNETESPGSSNFDDPSDGHKYIIPSFHRPDMLLADVKNSDFSFSSSRMLRPKGKMSFNRSEVDWGGMGVSPSPTPPTPDHPQFTGGNVTIDSNGKRYYFDPINGPWDIDNDNDGVTDSVWIDVGAPNFVIDSVTCKPLVAMLILDMDGRLNVNAHGSLKEIYFGTSHRALNPDPATGIYFASTDPDTTGNVPDAPQFATLPAGSNFGVAEVDLSLILDQSTLTYPGNSNDPWRKYALKNLLVGASGGPLTNDSKKTARGIELPNLKAEGRYGDSTDLHSTNPPYWYSTNPPDSLSPAPGKRGVKDPPRGTSSAPAIDSKTPDSFVSGSTADTYDYGSPIDPWGRMQIGTDSLGQPFYTRFDSDSSNGPDKWSSDAIDDPYDISLGRNAARPGWLYDPNVTVNTSPSSTEDNLYGPTDLERLLRLFDTDSKRLSGRILSAMGPASEFARLTMTTDSWDTTSIPLELSLWKELLQKPNLDPSLVSWDIQLGLRMNINRPFGDGQDNSPSGDPGYGIVDEPGEFSMENYGLPTNSPYVNQCLTNGRDVDGNSIVNVDDQNLARQLFARHLYVMARVLIDNNNLSAKDAAQWAVNVVDFRDSDSIITGFEYDDTFIKTSTTWNPNKTVWGCERPELLITEALAWNNYKEKEESTIPKTYSYSDLSTGGFVVEFYSPWTTQTDAGTRSSPLPSEFRQASKHKNPVGISMSAELDLLTKHSNASAFQLVAVEETTGVTSTKLTNDPTWPQQNADIKQIIYFQKGPDLDDSLPVNQSGSAFYMPQNTGYELQTLKPGQFAILGGNTIMPVGKNTGPAMTIKSINLDSNSFADTEPKQPVTVNILTETFDNGSQTNRMTSKEFPRDPTAGPVGAMIVTDTNFTLPVDRDPPPMGSPPGTEGNPTPKQFRLLFRRLANPLLDYESITNPYITVDSIVVQQLLTISDATRSSETLSFNSAQRGKTLDGVPSTDPDINNIWRQSDADVNSPGNPYSELGPYCGTVPTTVKWSLGFFSKGLKMPAKGSTSQTFPWLTWQNRPYTSTSELLLVPKSNSFTLLREHSGKAPYAHLFFNLETSDPKIGLLEFLRVPGRYADTDTWIDPAVADTLSQRSGTPMYLPPHNYMSEFREPGKINANTIANDLVWDAINSGNPSASYMDEGTDGDFVPSEDWPINASNTSGNGNWYLDANEDTNGNNRLDLNDDRNNNNKQELGRKTLSGSRRGWEITNGSSSPGNFDYILNRLGVTQNALWFSKPFQSSLDTEKSLLYRSNGSNGGNRDLLFSSKVHISDTVKARPYADSERNPYYRYRGINRLSNLLTTRSNVYAVWMTVGFFEIDSNGKLGQEFGAENGDIARHKSFMIIDRSLPLGYKKGIDLNVQDGIIHQRQVY